MTLSVFSGVPNPQWFVEPTQDLLRLYKEAAAKNLLFKVDAMPSRLGFRGFIIQEGKTEVLVLGPNTKNLQHKLLLTMPACSIPVKVRKRVFGEIESGSILPVGKKTRRKRYAPPFNEVEQLFADARTREKNNCYNYANIKVTNTFAQPGKKAGEQYTAITKRRILVAARKDGLASVEKEYVIGPNNPRHMVALVVEDCKYQTNSPVGSIFQILTILLIDPI